MTTSNNNTSKIIWIIIGVLAFGFLLLLIGVAFVTFNLLFFASSGSSTTEHTATQPDLGTVVSAEDSDEANIAVEYVRETYPDLNVEVTNSNRSYKRDVTIVTFQSPTSEDTAFEVTVGPDGKISYDDYEQKVVQKYSTYGRITQEASNLVEELVLKELPYNFTFVRADFGYHDQPEVTEKMELDMPFDSQNPPFPLHASVTLTDPDMSFAKVEEVMRAVRSVFNEHAIPLSNISVTLEPESGSNGPNDTLKAFDIPVEVLDKPDALAQIEYLSR